MITEKENIRKIINPKDGKWYFSVVDIISIVAETQDPRNYWKALKNRFKTKDNQLVTNCNQLKMTSSDGKSYLTDCFDSENSLKIIKMISPSYQYTFREFFEEIEHGEKKVILEKETGFELPLDMYQKDGKLYIESVLAGIEKENLVISINTKKIQIHGKRENLEEENLGELFTKELSWGNFSRQIELPYEIDLDESTAELKNGILKIELPKINKNRTKILKIK